MNNEAPNQNEIVIQQAQTPEDVQGNVNYMTAVRKILTTYIKDNLIEGVDFGSIQFGGKSSKPSLWKPGSEKMCQLFQLKAIFRKDIETQEMAGEDGKSTFFYLCELIDKRGNVAGEGRGAAKIGEKGRDINSTIKIAEKRAQVDAVLRTFALSEQFTQDLEDTVPATPAEQVTEMYQPLPPKEGQKVFTEPIIIENGVPNDWRGVVIHKGKQKGYSLSRLSHQSLQWWCENWKPRNDDPQDLALRAALDQAQKDMFGEPATTSDDQPF